MSPYCNIDPNSTFSNKDLEIISLSFKKLCVKFSKIICIYRPPRGEVKKCIDHLKEILARRENYKKEIWIVGDFNVDYLKLDNVNTKRFHSFFNISGLNQLICDITRPCFNHGTAIDWIVTNSKFFSTSGVTNIFVSDQFEIECIKKKARERIKNVYRVLRDYKNYNKDN